MMRIVVRRGAPVVALLALASAIPAASPQDRPREQASVVAVEVPVRVLLKGQPVRDLAASDFEIYENGRKQAITHLDVVSKWMVPPAHAAAPAEPAAGVALAAPRPRVFLLILNVFDYTDPVGDAIDHLFKDVVRPGDRVIVASEASFVAADAKEGRDAAADLKSSLKNLKVASAHRTDQAFRELKAEADNLYAVLAGLEPGGMDVNQAVARFCRKYAEVWEDYRRRHLRADPAFYEDLVGRIRRLDADAFAVCLQQRDLFPRLRNMSRLDMAIRTYVAGQVDPDQQVRARVLQTMMAELERRFDISSDVPLDPVRDVFLRAGIPFHLVLMKSVRTLMDEYYELREVGEDYEDVLSRISRDTGRRPSA